MDKKLMVSSEEPVTCPRCSHAFGLAEGLTEKTLEHYEGAYRKALKEREEALRQELEERARAEQAVERKALEEHLAENEKRLGEFRQQELVLRKDRERLEMEKAELDLRLQRQLDDERAKIEERVKRAEAEQYQLREAELRKKIEDAQRVNEDLKRKLEQGSQQLQGEVMELEVEKVLREAFPLDGLEAVKTGAHGADLVHAVRSGYGKECGKIVWEVKRAQNWSRDWLQKLKDDRQREGAELAVLVTVAMPEKTADPFVLMDDVWVAVPAAVKPLAEALRRVLIEAERVRLVDRGRSEKADVLYEYLFSPRFGQKLKAVIESFVAMKEELDQERRSLTKLWKRREAQLERVSQNVMEICGELEGVVQQPLPEIQSVVRLPLPEGED